MKINGFDMSNLHMELLLAWAEDALEILIDNQWGNGATDDGEIAFIKCPCCCNTLPFSYLSLIIEFIDK